MGDVETTSRRRERGSLGIGTLIVFVVVVIVAVVAAGVLVYTAMTLEESASDLLTFFLLAGTTSHSARGYR